MKPRPKYPDPYPDLIPKDQIQAYIFNKTGTSVSKWRIARWVNNGEIQLIQRPRSRGGGVFTRKAYLDELIRKYSD